MFRKRSRILFGLALFLIFVRETFASQIEFGTALRAKGEISIQDTRGISRSLVSGGRVYSGEWVRSAPSGEALLKTPDGGFVAIRPDSEFLIQSYLAEGDDDDHLFLELTKGSLRLISGWIGKLNKQAYKISTEDAAIGIRGTDHEPFVIPKQGTLAQLHPAGTYDKVNHGAVVLTQATDHLLVQKGQTGFVGAHRTTRGILSLIQPILLKQPPPFYRDGEFDSEIGPSSKAPPPLTQLPNAPCQQAALQWLDELDAAITQKNAGVLAQLISSDAEIGIQGHQEQNIEKALSQPELISSLTQTFSQLGSFQQQRRPAQIHCLQGGKRIVLRSDVRESGQQAGKPYSFHSEEEYILQKQPVGWQAIHVLVRPYSNAE